MIYFDGLNIVQVNQRRIECTGFVWFWCHKNSNQINFQILDSKWEILCTNL